jgi:hypothetical protein
MKIAVAVTPGGTSAVCPHHPAKSYFAGTPGRAGRVDGIVAGGEGDGVGRAVGMLLVERERARSADHHLGTVRVDFPRGPACVEAVCETSRPSIPSAAWRSP